MARSPVPVATSSARLPVSAWARSAARSRQRGCQPTVTTEIMGSYTRAMRSNIARTWVSGSVPAAGAAMAMPRLVVPALQRGDVANELVELLRLLLLEPLEVRHERGRVDEGS